MYIYHIKILKITALENTIVHTIHDKISSFLRSNSVPYIWYTYVSEFYIHVYTLMYYAYSRFHVDTYGLSLSHRLIRFS